MNAQERAALEQVVKEMRLTAEPFRNGGWTASRFVTEWADRLASLLTPSSPEQGEETAAKYYELLYAVARKHPNETRHQTALRYIRQAETHDPNQCAAASPSVEGKEKE